MESIAVTHDLITLFGSVKATKQLPIAPVICINVRYMHSDSESIAAVSFLRGNVIAYLTCSETRFKIIIMIFKKLI